MMIITKDDSILKSFLSNYKPKGKITNRPTKKDKVKDMVAIPVLNLPHAGGFCVYDFVTKELLWNTKSRTCVNEIVKDIARDIRDVRFYVATPNLTYIMVQTTK